MFLLPACLNLGTFGGGLAGIPYRRNSPTVALLEAVQPLCHTLALHSHDLSLIPSFIVLGY